VHAVVRRLLAGFLLVLSLAACGSGAQAASVPPAEPFAIRTAADSTLMCMDALLAGTLTRSAASGLGVAAENGQSTAIEWPFGYSARVEADRVVLVDETGKVVAREGEAISLGGGLGNALWYACGPVTVIPESS
jgi:hypothetical protein